MNSRVEAMANTPTATWRVTQLVTFMARQAKVACAGAAELCSNCPQTRAAHGQKVLYTVSGATPMGGTHNRESSLIRRAAFTVPRCGAGGAARIAEARYINSPRTEGILGPKVRCSLF